MSADEYTPTKPPHKRSCCLCDDCLALRKVCPHPKWRGRSQFMHDSYETMVWRECVECGEMHD